jgi:hypothetical protein
MSVDDRDVLEVLNSELRFLENGGYKPSPRTQRRPPFIFEDSPTCLNYGSRQRLLPCSECVLMAFVPQDCRGERIPCRHISLDVEGYTIDTYYRLGAQEDLEVDVADWLRKTIQPVEGEGAQQQRESRDRGQNSQSMPGSSTLRNPT